MLGSNIPMELEFADNGGSREGGGVVKVLIMNAFDVPSWRVFEGFEWFELKGD